MTQTNKQLKFYFTQIQIAFFVNRGLFNEGKSESQRALFFKISCMGEAGGGIGQIGHQSAVVMTPEQRAVYLRVSTCFGGSFI